MAEIENSQPALLYGEDYYRHFFPDLPYTRDEPHWLRFFGMIADRIVLSLSPKRVLDAGCAMGFLVESLWDRGVEAWGIDISEYAVSRVRRDMAPYCRAGSLTEPLTGRFDLITCIEVLEHIPERDARIAIQNLTAATETILFSSTPKDLTEPTHFNVRPIMSWLRLFGEFGFHPDVLFDAEFVSPQAYVLRRSTSSPPDETLVLFARFIQQRIDTHERNMQIARLEQSIAAREAELHERNMQIARQEQSIAAREAELQAQIAEIGARVNEQGVALRQQSMFQSQVGLSISKLKIDIDRRFLEIYSSRIWQTLVAGGAFLERLPGLGKRRPERSSAVDQNRAPETSEPGGGTAPGEAVHYAPPDSMRMKIDEPSPLSPVFSGSVLRIQGWAVAQKGIDRVEVWLNDGGPNEATYGLMRADVHEAYGEFSSSEHCGFTWSCSTALLNAGANHVRVRATSLAGTVLETSSVFLVDARSAYELWVELHTSDAKALVRFGEECRRFGYLPKISIVTPVFRTPEAFLRKCVESVRRQVYSNWELILVDDGSGQAALSKILNTYAAMDARIRVESLAVNRGMAGATNAGLAMSNGDYVGLLDHDDELSADALYYVLKTLNEDPSLDVLYSDEDKLDCENKRCDAFFKPDWSPDLLGSMNYVCHFLVSRRSLVETVGGVRLGFEASQDYDLILRLSERTNKIRRIPRVLYHWRIHPQSTAMQTGQKPLASDAGRRALEDHLQRTGAAASVIEVGPCRYRIRYDISGAPEVAIIIPTGGNARLNTAIKSVLELTSYRNYRIVVVDNSSGDDVRQWVKQYESGPRPVDWFDCRRMPFNFSLLCNRGAARTDSPYLLFLNDDTAVIASDWLEAMLEHAQRPEVGAVGAQLLFPDGTLQHAGVIMGIFGVAGHAFRGLDPTAPHYFSLSNFVRNCAAVTGACLLTRREVFTKVGGFDEKYLPTCFQDVDLCLKMVGAGYRIVYTPYARLYHYESATKKSIARVNEIQYMQERWKSFLNDDPFYNPNLTRISDGYELDLTGCE